jgi:Tat protein secretion system quality control protein TatD with DNase activity
MSKLVRKGKLAQDRCIQLHYFRGDQTTVLKWGGGGELFPNVHYSISGSVEQFTPAEKLGLRIMLAQILLETDAPHGKLSSVPISQTTLHSQRRAPRGKDGRADL